MQIVALITQPSSPLQQSKPIVVQPPSEPINQPTNSYLQRDINYFLIIIGLAILARVILGNSAQVKT